MASASPSSVPQGRMPGRRKTHACLAGTGRASSSLTNTTRERVMERVMMKLYLNLEKRTSLFNNADKLQINRIKRREKHKLEMIKFIKSCQTNLMMKLKPFKSFFCKKS